MQKCIYLHGNQYVCMCMFSILSLPSLFHPFIKHNVSGPRPLFTTFCTVPTHNKVLIKQRLATYTQRAISSPLSYLIRLADRAFAALSSRSFPIPPWGEVATADGSKHSRGHLSLSWFIPACSLKMVAGYCSKESSEHYHNKNKNSNEV